MTAPKERVLARPAETAGAGATIGGLVAVIAGVRDTQTLAYIIGGIGLVPAAVTFLVDNGGVRGVVRTLWRGKK
jgi:hypothetical protein